MVVNYIIEKASPFSVVVTWPNMQNGDTGQPFDISDFGGFGVEFSGTLGVGGEYVLNSAYSILNPVFKSGNPSMVTLPNILGVDSGSLLQPAIINGDGTTDITATALLVLDVNR